MSTAELAAALDALDREPAPAVIRFDPGPAPGGRVAVLPSAFNPPTTAHLALIDVGLAVPGVGSAAALLSTKNVDKGRHGASLADRVGMLLALHESRPRLAVLATNAARIADQAQALGERYPAAEFDFIVGFDTLVRLFDPRYYRDMPSELAAFFAHHQVIAANRGEATRAVVEDFVAHSPARPFARRVIVRELDQLPASLSSTAARDDIAHDRRPGSLPPEVQAYIEEHLLYRG